MENIIYYLNRKVISGFIFIFLGIFIESNFTSEYILKITLIIVWIYYIIKWFKNLKNKKTILDNGYNTVWTIYDIKSLLWKENEYTLFIKYIDKFWTEHKFKENTIVGMFNDKTGYWEKDIKLDKETWNYKSYIKKIKPRIDIVYSKYEYSNATIVPKFKIYLGNKKENINKSDDSDINKNITENINNIKIKKFNHLKYVIFLLLWILMIYSAYHFTIEMTDYVDNMDCPTCFGMMWWWVLMLWGLLVLWIIWILWMIIFSLTISYWFINYITQYNSDNKVLRVISMISLFIWLLIIFYNELLWNITLIIEKKYFILFLLTLIFIFISIISFAKTLFTNKN